LKITSKLVGAIAPVIVAIVTILLILSDPPDTVYGNQLLTTILAIIFIGANYFLVAYIAGRSYTRTGSLSFLLLGSSLVIAGCASVLTYTVSTAPNFTSTVFNLGFFSAAIFSIIAAITSYYGNSRENVLSVRKWVGIPIIVYTTLALLSVAIALSALRGSTPMFVEQSASSTALRQTVVGLSILLFGASSVISLRMYTESRSDILFWYSGGLAMLAVSFLPTFFLNVTAGTELSWIGRIAKYLSGIYFLVIVLSSTRKQPRIENDAEKMKEIETRQHQK
jgi:hypothetical protein